jgi:hypothetical protein
LLSKYDLRKKIIVYVKDERSNLNIMIATLKSLVNYDVLGLIESFQGSYLAMHSLRFISMFHFMKLFVSV